MKYTSTVSCQIGTIGIKDQINVVDESTAQPPASYKKAGSLEINRKDVNAITEDGGNTCI